MDRWISQNKETLLIWGGANLACIYPLPNFYYLGMQWEFGWHITNECSNPHCDGHGFAKTLEDAKKSVEQYLGIFK
jgi:hypothetical protein